MALMTRLNRLFQADLHALLDRLEAPELLLRQALREMEEELARAGRSLAANEAELRRCTAQLKELDGQRARLVDELDLAFAADNEPLARLLLKRRLLLDGQRTQWHSRSERLHSEQEAQQLQLKDRRQRLTDLQQQSELLLSTAEIADDFGPRFEASIRESDVDLALLAEKLRRRS